MALLNGFKDFFDGLARGFGLFFTERNDHIIAATTLGLTDRK